MRNLIAPKYSSKNFTFVPDESKFGGTFVIEMSTLQALGGIQQIWEGSPEAGFIIVSAKTGKEAVFVCTEIKHDSERDVVYWKLNATFSSYNQHGCSRLQWTDVQVFNT